MAIEIERKFLVSGDFLPEAVSSTRIVQGYICSQPGKGSFVCAKDGVDETRKKELLGKFDELVTELGYIGVDKPQLIERLKGE